MQAFFKAWILFLADNPVSFADSLQPFSLLTAEDRSTVTVRGGMKELKRIFLDKIEYFGGTIIEEPPADYVFETESSQVRGVIFDGYHFSTRCRYLLGNEPFGEQLAHIPRSLRTRRYCRQMNRQPTSREYKISFLTSSAILPEPMCQDILFIQDPVQPLIDSNYFRMHATAIPNPPDHDEDMLLEVAYYLPTTDEPELTEEAMEAFERRHDEIEACIRNFIPFSYGKFRRIFPLPGTNQDDLFDDAGQDYTHFMQKARREERYPPSFSFPGLGTPFDNLLTLGPDQLSWLGLGGRLQGALKAVEYIWDKDGRHRNIR